MKDISANWVYIGSDIIEKESERPAKITGSDETGHYIVDFGDGQTLHLGCDVIRDKFKPHPDNVKRTNMNPSLPYQGIARRAFIVCDPTVEAARAKYDKEIDVTALNATNVLESRNLLLSNALNAVVSTFSSYFSASPGKTADQWTSENGLKSFYEDLSNLKTVHYNMKEKLRK